MVKIVLGIVTGVLSLLVGWMLESSGIFTSYFGFLFGILLIWWIYLLVERVSEK